MNQPLRCFVIIAGILIFHTHRHVADAAPVIFTHEGIGSGQLDGVSFTSAQFAITATGDTEDRVVLGADIFAIQHLTASITIEGLGGFDFTIPTRTFVNDDLIGFSRSTTDGFGGADLFNGPSDAELRDYELLTSIGPISGNAQLIQWASVPEVTTSGGTLVFETNNQVVGTFTARIVPEPSSVALLVFGLIVAMRRRA